MTAALDLGSNTLRLLVAKVAGNRYFPLKRGLATPRLGQGLKPGAKLSPQAKSRAAQDAARFVDLAREMGAGTVALAATQACRLAADGPEFVAHLGQELGLDQARVISGAQEGRLSRLGVLSRLEGTAGGALLADVGGGSSELAWLVSGGEDQPLSLPLGAVSLSEAHINADPPGREQLSALDEAVDSLLAQANPGKALGQRPGRLVATAGTAAACASLALGLKEYRPESIDNTSLSLEELDRIFGRLAAMPLAQRKRELELDPPRAEVILGGLAILRGLLRYFHLERLTAMDAGLLEGILMEAAGLAHPGE